jgi:hypothetical protein
MDSNFASAPAARVYSICTDCTYRGGTEQAGKYTFFYGKGREIHELGTGFSYIRKSYQQ